MSNEDELMPLQHSRNKSTGSAQLRRRRPSTLRDVTKMVMKMNSASRRNLMDDTGSRSEGVSSRHTRNGSSVPFHEESSHPLAETTIFAGPNKASTFMDHAQHLENLFSTGPRDTYSDLPDSLLNRGPRPGSTSIREDEDEDEEGGVMEWTRSNDVERGGASPARETTNLLPTLITQPKRNKFCRCCREFAQLFPCSEIARRFKHFLSTTFAFFMVPGLILATFFYYSLDNPDLQFLPSTARLSWFCLFAVRQSVTLTLAQITQYILVVFTLKTTILVKLAGPLVALVVMQSKGWPFLVGAWGCWNLLLLHGDSAFIKHWLYWTKIRLFSMEYNSGNGILASDFYGRILASMIVVGVAAATKRTFMALYMSRRTLQYYRTQLESVMGQIALVSEVADLAAKTTEPGFENLIKENLSHLALERKEKGLVETVPTFVNSAKEAKKKESKEKSSRDSTDTTGMLQDMDVSDDEDEPFSGADRELDEALGDKEQMEIQIDPKLQWQALKERSLNDRDTINFAGNDLTRRDSGSSTTASGKDPSSQRKHKPSRRTTMSTRGGMATIFPFLDRWHEPKDMGKKVEAATLHDILQFKKAMHFMDMDCTFGEAYGSCVDRKQTVKNAVRVYRRLLKFTPDKPMVNFDVIAALAYDENGSLDEDRAIALLRLFFPDKDDRLPMLAFVQTCDNVYKQMRFLRASLSNSTKIDGVLEDMFNAFFYFCLSVAIALLLGFNPWPILVSLSTLTVSFAFAFGPSVAKNVEGILMIAVRRPYDIGDRITLCGAEMVANPTAADTWLVEDISLTTTSLRYASTNELATVNNASIANSRVVNFKRSSKAMVTILLRLVVDTTQQQLDDFCSAMEAYFENRPREWIGLIHKRVNAVDSDNGFVTYLFRAQHVKSWQELGAIMISKGDWERHADKIATEMGINLSTPPKQMTVGLGLAPDTFENKYNEATLDRKHVADFIRSLSKGSGGSGDGKPFDSIAEYFTDSAAPAAPAAAASGDDAAASTPMTGSD